MYIKTRYTSTITPQPLISQLAVSIRYNSVIFGGGGVCRRQRI